MRQSFLSILFVILLSVAPAQAWDVLELQHEGRTVSVEGKVLVRAADEGLLVLARDGQIWPIPPEELVRHAETEGPFEPLGATELGNKLVAERGAGFEVWYTKHYVICYNTNREYAKWCGRLFERLYKRFTNYWSRQGFAIREPEFPLPVLVFADQPSYAAAAFKELGEGTTEVPGYYSYRTNRVSIYDLTSHGAGVAGARRSRSVSEEMQRVLSRPGGSMTMATVVHEATHQLAFNCGLQRRYADNPLWLSEGMAIYFETPDVKNKDGWGAFGKINELRLRRFLDYVGRGRPADSLQTLVQSDDRLHDLTTGPDAYAEAWSLTYFLLRTRTAQYHQYLRAIHEKTPLVLDSPEERRTTFEKAFGRLDVLDREFLEYLGKALQR